MNFSSRRSHSVDILSCVLLFGLFLFFLLLMILFSAKAYETSVAGSDENNNLRTAASYVTVKFHQHDTDDHIFIGEINNTKTLCMSDVINGQEYVTYLYLLDGQLKELFAPAELSPDPKMGTSIASLTCFYPEMLTDGYYQITMEDEHAHTSRLLLHAGVPES